MSVAENVQRIHQASMEILAKTGMMFHHPEALEVLKEHGIRVEGNLAFFTEEQLMTYVKKAPAYAKLYAADPTYNMEIGGSNRYTGPAGGSTFIMDKDGNTRDAMMMDFLKLIKLYEGNPKYHINGGLACQPSDIPTDTSTILLAYTSLLHTNKCVFTAAGILAITNAEILATIALAQMVAPGAPVIYGSQSAGVDMASGAMAIGLGVVGGIVADKFKYRSKFLVLSLICATIASAVMPFLTNYLWVAIIVSVVISAINYMMKAIYFSIMDEALIPRHLTGAASGIAAIILAIIINKRYVGQEPVAKTL